MSFFCKLTRRHYWCTPHRNSDNKLVQVCYECGAERAARELHNELMPEWFNNRPGNKAGPVRLAPKPASETTVRRPAQADTVTISFAGERKLSLVK